MDEDEGISMQDACKKIQEHLSYCRRFLFHVRDVTNIDMLKEEVEDAFESLRLLEHNFDRIQQVLK